MVDPLFHFADNCVLREQSFSAFEVLEKHTHTYSHLSIVLKGTFAVVVGDSPDFVVYGVGSIVTIPANTPHTVQALENDSRWACIHSELE
jgi:quercetin dioxygenase-like cupin family protein